MRVLFFVFFKKENSLITVEVHNCGDFVGVLLNFSNELLKISLLLGLLLCLHCGVFINKGGSLVNALEGLSACGRRHLVQASFLKQLGKLLLSEAIKQIVVPSLLLGSRRGAARRRGAGWLGGLSPDGLGFNWLWGPHRLGNNLTLPNRLWARGTLPDGLWGWLRLANWLRHGGGLDLNGHHSGPGDRRRVGTGWGTGGCGRNLFLSEISARSEKIRAVGLLVELGLIKIRD